MHGFVEVYGYKCVGKIRGNREGSPGLFRVFRFTICLSYNRQSKNQEEQLGMEVYVGGETIHYSYKTQTDKNNVTRQYCRANVIVSVDPRTGKQIKKEITASSETKSWLVPWKPYLRTL